MSKLEVLLLLQDLLYAEGDHSCPQKQYVIYTELMRRIIDAINEESSINASTEIK